MPSSHFLLVGLLFLQSIFSFSSFGARKVVFQSSLFQKKAAIGQFTEIDLKSLLSETGIGPLVWQTFSDKPGWLTLDSAKGKLSGTPALSDLGKRTFRISVQDVDDTGALSRIEMNVVVVPQWTESPLNLGHQKEDTAFSFDLSTKVTNPSGGTLKFSVEDPSKLPKWMSLKQNGILSGTPSRTDVGNYSGFAFIVENNSGETARVDAFGVVDKVVKPPRFKANPTSLGDAQEDFAYSLDISTSDYVFRFEPEPITFKLISGTPSGWLKLSSNGVFSGTPGKGDLGAVSVQVELSSDIDGKTYKDSTVVEFEVLHTNHKPQWQGPLVVLPDALTKQAYFQDLLRYVTDPDGDTLQFKATNGPKWGNIAKAGSISGTPQNADFGVNTWTVEVSDGSLSDTANIQVTVVNRPPKWITKPTVLPGGKEDSAYSQSLLSYVADADGDSLTFEKISGPAWITVSSLGVVSGTPGAGDLNLNQFTVKVSDGVSGSDQSEVQITVVHTNHAPTWTQSPIVLGPTPERVLFDGSVASFIKDVDPGDTWKVTKVSGPAWLVVAEDGKVSGTPQRPEVGLNTFQLKVTDQDGLSSTVTLQIEVLKVNQAPVWSSNPIPLVDALEGASYSFDLKKYASDPDGDALSYTLITGPQWMAVSPDGIVTGIPALADVGNFTATFQVTDGQLSAKTGGAAKVIMKNYPPVANIQHWTFQVKERSTLQVNLNDPKYVTDPNGDLLTFARDGNPDFTVVSTMGQMTVTPLFADIGVHTYTVRISDGKLTTPVTLTIEVLRDPRPPVWTENPIRFQTQARVPFNADISGKAKDLDGLALTFTKKSGPAWLSVSAQGKISGTPEDSDLGKNTFVVSANNDLLGANVDIEIEVLFNNHAPYWTANPIALPPIPEKVAFNGSVADFAKDQDGDVLVIEKLSGPSWLSVSSSGGLSGTPGRADVGINSFQLKVTDTQGLSATTALTLEVLKVNQAPLWTETPLPLPNALEGSLYSFDLKKYATDPDGDKLQFSLLTAPGWLSLNADGVLSGIPALSDVANFAVTVKVSDGALSSDNQGSAKVIMKNYPPVVHAEHWTFQVKEREILELSLDDPKYVSDPNGDGLTFTKEGAIDFTTLSTVGLLSVKPAFKDIGTHTYQVHVSDGTLTTDVTLTVVVLRNPRPPVWTENPISFQAQARVPFAADISSKAKDLDGLSLTFSKKSGPAWLSIDKAGKISGTPDDSDLGMNSFTVTVSNDLLGADATLEINVLFNNHAPYWTANPIALPPIPEKVAFNGSVADYAKDQDGDALLIEKISGPAWLSVSSSGGLSGTPGRTDVGVNTFQLKVTDTQGLSATTALTIEVLKVNQAPYWTENPLPLPNALEGSLYSFDLQKYVGDPDGDKLSITLLTGPQWLSVTGNGVLTGVPALSDVADFTITVKVSDGSLSADAAGAAKVLMKNYPPVVHVENWNFVVKERETLEVNLNDPKYVTDPNGDALIFSKDGASDFTEVSALGKLTLKPLFKDIGLHTYVVNIDDGKAVTNVQMTVTVERSPRPPVWTENPIQFQAQARIPFAADISTKAKDLDGIAITFTKKSGPAWLSIDSAGKLSGTPEDSDVGANTFVVTVSNDLLGADADLKIEVLFNNHAPYWTENPITLPPIPEKTAFNGSVAAFAKDADGDVLKIEKISGPSWLTVATDGSVSGTPARTDVGLNSFALKVTDPLGLSANVTLNIEVQRVNDPPYWTQNPVPLVNGMEDSPYSFDLKKYAADPDNDPLVFSKLTGPDWLVVNSSGAVSGIPGATDVGDFTATFQVTDGKASSDASGSAKIVLKNHPPVVHLENWNFVVKERDTLVVDLNDPRYVTDPNGDLMTFTKEGPLDFVNLSSMGQLTLKPVFTDIGLHTYQVHVSDGISTTDVEMKVEVQRNPRPPVWIENPIQLQAKARVPFSADISAKAKDLDGIAITFTKKSGPAWLSIDSAGKLSGTPEDADLGPNAFVVTVNNDLLGADADLNIEVLFNNHAPYWTENPITGETGYVGQSYQKSVVEFAKDPDNDVLKFTKISGASWLGVSETGLVFGTPGAADTGNQEIQVRITDPSGLTAVTVVKVPVEKINHAPVWVVNPLVLNDAHEDMAFSQNVSSKAMDPDGDSLTFSKISGPNWWSITPDGIIAGTPSKDDLGSYEGELSVSDGKLSANVKVTGVVKKTNHPPLVNNTVLKFEVKERATLAVDISKAPYVTDPDNDPLTFRLMNATSFVALSSKGSLAAAPLHGDIGVHSFNFEVSDGLVSEPGVIEITVVRDPRPPVWTENPILLGATAKVPFSDTLSTRAKDLDGVPLTFKKNSGPDWLTVDANGKLTGTPTLADLGDNSFEVEARNDLLGAVATLTIKVVQDNHAPYWTESPLKLGDIQVGKAFSFDLSKYAVDPDADPLVFKKLSGPSWLKVNGTGQVTGTPAVSDIGEFIAEFEVNDGLLTAMVDGYGRVIPEPVIQPPQWLENPIRFTTKVSVPFNADISTKVKDPQGLQLVISKNQGPAWLSVSGAGALTGTPPQIGEDHFTLTASNGQKSANVEVIITVTGGGTGEEVVDIFQPVAGARAENVWAVDNSWPYLGKNDLVESLKSRIGVYFGAIAQYQLHLSGVYLSTDVKKFFALPVTDDDGKKLLHWTDNDIVPGFGERASKTFLRQSKSSSIWSLFKFYEQLPGLEFYQKDYFDSDVPMDVLIVTQFKDQYSSYTGGTAQSQWKPLEFADSFLANHQKEMKPYHISVIAPKCMTEQQKPLMDDHAENVYRTLVDRTGGQFYEYGCDFKIDKALQDYAGRVASRAYITAKNNLSLSHTPNDATKIEVLLAGKVLPKTVWEYRAQSNTIHINWSMVDMNQLKPGDKLTVRYPY